jgi:hypothetical protein
MRKFLYTLAAVGLLLTLLPAVVAFFTPILPATQHLLMLAGTLLWFGAAIGINQKKASS